VHEIQELQFELPAPNDGRRTPPSRLKLGIALVVGTVAAFFAALALSALLAHPAGASVLPGSSTDDPAGLISSVTQPLVSSVGAVDAPDLGSIAPVTNPVAPALIPVLSPAVTTLAPLASPVVAPLTPVVSPVLVAVAPVVGPVVTALSPVLAPTLSATAGLLSPAGSDLSAHAPIRPTDASSGLVAEASGVHIVSSAPVPLPRPHSPLPTLPSGPTPSSTDGSGSPSGSNAPAAQPPLGLLLPDPMVTGLTLAGSKSPGLLFDPRHSPPG
jgi:hypothetical protein